MEILKIPGRPKSSFIRFLTFIISSLLLVFGSVSRETNLGILFLLISLVLFWRVVGDPVFLLKQLLDHNIKYDNSIRKRAEPIVRFYFPKRYSNKTYSRFYLSYITIGLLSFFIGLLYNNSYALFLGPPVLFIGLHAIDLDRLQKAKNISLYILVWIYLVFIYIESIRYITSN